MACYCIHNNNAVFQSNTTNNKYHKRKNSSIKLPSVDGTLTSSVQYVLKQQQDFFQYCKSWKTTFKAVFSTQFSTHLVPLFFLSPEHFPHNKCLISQETQTKHVFTQPCKPPHMAQFDMQHHINSGCPSPSLYQLMDPWLEKH